EVVAEKLNKVLANLEAGSFFGELALMLGTPRTATIRALEETVLFAISHKHFEHFLQSNPSFCEVIIQELSKHQEELTQRKQELELKGLIPKEENDPNLVNWIKKRLNRLFEL
ncbi:MAG: cyclic nucleotide-binding domain-containing protein, partial [Microcystaceae cyanobacterium]